MRHRYGDFGSFGMGARDHVAGPLLGGGIAQVATLGTKLIWPASKAARWAGAIGTLAGGLVSGLLAMKPRYRSLGVSGLVTAALVGVPRQIEDLMTTPGAAAGYLGVITPEQVSGYFGQQPEVELLDSGAGGGTLGVITPEQVQPLGQNSQAPEIELMGGFGSNFLSAQ